MIKMAELNDFFSDFMKVCDKCNSVICSCNTENSISHWVNKFICGDSLHLANQLPDESIDCVFTSPPYFNLRRYSDNDREIGIEQDPYEYINNLVLLFKALKRKLKSTGTIFINIGDSYFGGCGGHQSWERESRNIEWNEQSVKNPHRRDKSKHKWMKPKQLMLIPSRFAIEMQNAGFILRNDIIWHKPNSAPTSVKDRFKNSFEHIFFFVKNNTYFTNIDDVREKHKTSLKSLQNRIDYDTERRGGKLQEGEIGTGIWSNQREINPLGTIPQDTINYENDIFNNITKNPNGRIRLDTLSEEEKMHPLGKTPSDSWEYDKRDENEPQNYTSLKNRQAYNRKVLGLEHDSAMNHPLGKIPNDFFSINTYPSSIPHYAQFPQELLIRPLTFGCPKEVCIKCGIPRMKEYEKIGGPQGDHTKFMNESIKTGHSFDASGSTLAKRYAEFGYPELLFKGYKQCKCKAEFRKGVVLDPFMGVATTAIVCEKLGFDWIGFELLEKNIKYSYERLSEFKKQKEFLDVDDFKEMQKLKRDAVKTKPLMEFA